MVSTTASPATVDVTISTPTMNPCIDDGDTAWVLTATLLVLAMIPGLALFEAGLLRARNTVSILTQVICGVAIMGCLWYFIGFSLVYGESLGGFIGNPASYPILLSVPNNGCFEGMHIPGLAYVTFQMMFASITPLLMTGAFAERFLWTPYVIFIVAWEFLVFYPCAHWIWGGGWLDVRGVLDFAGGIVIHTSAGAGSLVAAYLVQRRIGFGDGHIHPSNVPIACVGGAFLWMGWFGFNAGSALSSTYVAATVVANTQIASSISALVWLVLAWWRGRPNVEHLLNGAIAGLAGITPAAGYVSTLSAMVIGFILGLSSFYSVAVVKQRWRIDDALDVSSVHGLTGVIGSIAIGFCADHKINPAIKDGLIMGGGGELLGYQVLAVVVVAAWGGFWTFVILKVIQRFMPLSSLDMDLSEADVHHLDQLEHDMTAYGHAHDWVVVKDHDHHNNLDYPLLRGSDIQRH